VLNPFMHSKMQFKQQKMVISPRSVSSDSGEKVQKVECLDNSLHYNLFDLLSLEIHHYTNTYLQFKFSY
jgi:hypothetical protein